MEYQVKNLKNLDRWGTILLSLEPMLRWEQTWHPYALAGGISAFYLILYCLNLNTLTTIAVLGILFNLVDFYGPLMVQTVYGPNFWNGHMMKRFENLCDSINLAYSQSVTKFVKFYQMREKQPAKYYGITLSVLLCLAFLFSSVNNFLLFYIMTMGLMLWPGIQNKGGFHLLRGKTEKAD